MTSSSLNKSDVILFPSDQLTIHKQSDNTVRLYPIVVFEESLSGLDSLTRIGKILIYHPVKCFICQLIFHLNYTDYI